MLESFAVRSGRSIVQAVLDEMTLLRRAAERFGAGDLDYRLPTQGKDEFSVVATSFNDMAASLKRQQEELVAKERLEEDLKVAREIQQRFLPQSAPGLAGLDVAGVSSPSREVGGDLFYWFAHDDGSLGFTLGDVSGKSVPAALLMSNVLSALRAQAIVRAEVAESLARTNRLIIDQIEPGRFVTLFYGEVDPRRSELHYASAGHNPPLLVRAGGALEWLREGGVPLGVLPEAEYTATRVAFALGDTLIVYSDGVTEAEGPAGAPSAPELFGEERLAAAVGGLGERSAHEVLDAVLQAVEAFAAGRPQADDITVLVVRRV
jgi:sigma-B regulation protein RsbU (phosphoserine phosphatase)